jgi:hypothetical protein
MLSDARRQRCVEIRHLIPGLSYDRPGIQRLYTFTLGVVNPDYSRNMKTKSLNLRIKQ